MITLLRRLSVFLLLIASFAFPTLRAATGRDLANQILLPERVLARADELALTADQRSALAAEQQRQRSALANSFAATRRATDALTEQLSSAQPDEATVLARFDELNAAETLSKRERLLTTVRIRRLLTAEQLARLQSETSASASPSATTHIPAAAFARDPASSTARATIPQLLQQVRSGIDTWRTAGRDLTEVNKLWAQFRRHADAREHPQARQSLQDLVTLLSTPATAPATPPAKDKP